MKTWLDQLLNDNDEFYLVLSENRALMRELVARNRRLIDESKALLRRLNEEAAQRDGGGPGKSS